MAAKARTPFIELGLMTNFSFLQGASDPAELVSAAHVLGYDAIGIADRNTLAGVVRLHVAAAGLGLRPIIGCRLDLLDAPSLYAYPKSRAGYGRLCRLLSAAKMQNRDGAWQGKGQCDLSLSLVSESLRAVDDPVLIAVPDDDLDAFSTGLPRLCQHLPVLGHIAASYLYRGDDRARINRLSRLAVQHGLRLVATNDVHYHAPARRPLQDVMTCIRQKLTITKAGQRLHANAERYLKSPEEMLRLFADWPDAIRQSRMIADACRFSLAELRYEYPSETVPENRTPDDYLAELVWAGGARRYPEGMPDKVRKTLNRELAMIAKLDIARYFLTIHDIVRFARGEGILCQGRGSAANSAVCYCLEVTSVDPAQHELLFERFVSEERKEPPDIDVDFEHERREEVIQHIYQRYGRDRAGLCATVIHYRPRMAIREVGKVMGLSEDITAALAGTVWGSWGKDVVDLRVKEAGLDISDPHLKRTLALAGELIGMPRHLSQHVGGFILTESPLVETVPVGNGAMAARSFIEWDKDDIAALGIMKVDVLALGMLTCIRKSFALIAAHYGRAYSLATIPDDDPAVYDMLCRADSVGVFQIESRAQMNMLPRLKPRAFYDLVIQVAIVRPGPIQGDMVHPYLRRRQGKEREVYPSPGPEYDPDELRNILQRTLGVPIFQEQAMKIAMVAACFSPAEANQLRKAMATFRSRGKVSDHKEKMVGRMVERGYAPVFAERCFSQIEGFGEYGFPESHAASFALLAYVSSWIKCHYPAVFAAALLNSQPMGFYAPAQIIRDVREHGVTVLPVDINFSDWDNSLEPCAGAGGGSSWAYALRLGLRQIEGFSGKDALRLTGHRRRPYEAVADLRHRARLSPGGIRLLAAADAFRSIGKDRRAALWDARAIREAPDLPLFTHADAEDEGEDQPVSLPEMPLSEHVVTDYQTMRFSLKAHPMAFLRKAYARREFMKTSDLPYSRFGQWVSIAGLVLVRQRPGSASGVVFITLEDESGVANLVIWPDIVERHRKIVMGARLLAAHGRIQIADNVIHLVVRNLEDETRLLDSLVDGPNQSASAEPDNIARPASPGSGRHPRSISIIPKSRDFH